MVAFVLVLLAIAMITTVSMLATRVQIKTAESQQRMTQLAEAAYRGLQPVYDEAKQCWKKNISDQALSNKQDTQLTFTGNDKTFTVDVQTADWTVSAETDTSESDSSEAGTTVSSTYHIYLDK